MAVAARRPASRNSRTVQNEPLPPQVAWICVAGAAVLAVVAAWFGLPAGVVVAAGVVAAAVLHPSPELTGKHPVSKSPQPDGPVEQAQLDEHRFFTGWMNQLMNPVNLLWPRPATVVAWCAGVFAAMLPAAYGWVPAVSAVAAALVVAGWCAAKRGVGEGGEPQPAVEFKSVGQVWTAGPGVLIGHAVAGAAAGVAVVWLLFQAASWQVVHDARTGFAEMVGGLPAEVMGVDGNLAGVAAGAAGFGAAWAVSVPWRKAALEHWRELMGYRAEWRPRWEQLKMTEPRLQEFRMVGDATVFTFDTQGKGTSQEFIDLMSRGKLAPMLDSTVTHVATTVPIVGKDGQPQPGTVSPTGFEYTAWPEGLPSLMVVGDDEVMRHALTCAMSQVAQQAALPVPQLDRFVALRTNPQVGEAGMWATTWMGVHGATLRGMLAGGLGQLLGCHVVADNRTFGGAGTVYLGDFGADDVTDGPRVDLAGGLTAEQEKDVSKAGDDEAALVEASWKVLGDLQLEDQWEATWKDALKQTVNPPTIRHFHHKADKLANGKVVEQQAFSVRLGMDPYEYMNQKTETALANGATPRPFLVVTPWVMNPERDSECHGSLLVVHSSTDRVPTVSKLAPVDGSSAPQSVLTGYVLKAFDHAKLTRPTVARVECMTSAGSREHVWRIRLWLYGGVTLADVRKAERKLQSAMGVEWLRVGQEGRNCVIVAGVDPTNRSVRLAKPDFRRQLLAYDWAALWSDAGVVSQSGELPRLLEAAQMPQNDLVTRMVFTIPPGKSVASMRAQQAKLSSASKNAFVDIRQSKKAADQVEVLVAKESPMPFPAPFDFDAEFDPTHIPYATGVDGVPVVLNRDRMAHLGVFGTAGGGKSAAAQTILTGALLAGCEVYVADVQKQAADFKYAEPWLSGIATTSADVLATMEHLYAEKDRRVTLNSKYGAGHCRELPDGVRPPPIWFFMDEFFGMVQKAKPAPKPEADPELEAARQELAREYDTAKRIAFLTGRFAAEARSADIHLVVMTQKLTKDMLDSSAAGPGALSDLKTNLNVLLLGKTKIGDRASALRAWEDAPDLGEQVPPGRGLFEPVDDAMQIVQVWYASTAEHVEVLSAELDPVSKVDLGPYRAKERNTSGFVELGGTDAGAGLFTDVGDDGDGGGVEVVELEVDVSEFDFSFLDELDETDAAAGVGVDVPASVAGDGVGDDVVGDDVVGEDHAGDHDRLAGGDDDGTDAAAVSADAGWGLPEPDGFFQELGFTTVVSAGDAGDVSVPVVDASGFDRSPERVAAPPAAGWGWDDFPAVPAPVSEDAVDDGLLDDVFRPGPAAAAAEELVAAEVVAVVEPGRDVTRHEEAQPPLEQVQPETEGDTTAVRQHTPEDTSDLDDARARSRKPAPKKPETSRAGTGRRKQTPAQRRRNQNSARKFLPDDALDDDFEPRRMPDPLGEALQARTLPAKPARHL